MKIGNTEIVIRQVTPTRENLKAVYDICNKLFKDPSLFYTSEQVKQLKKDKNNVFL